MASFAELLMACLSRVFNVWKKVGLVELFFWETVDEEPASLYDAI